MSKTNDTLKHGHAKLEDRVVLADSELAAVTGRPHTQHPAKVTIPDLKLSQGIR